MTTHISNVEAAFEITGRGCIVVPGMPLDLAGVNLKVGDRIVLKRPDGSEIETQVRGFEMGSRNRSGYVPMLLGKELTKDRVPAGTQLWTK